MLLARDKHLLGIAYGKGLFVAVGINGTILTSKDGISWTRQKLEIGHPNDVACGNGRFVAVGYHGIIFTSP